MLESSSAKAIFFNKINLERFSIVIGTKDGLCTARETQPGSSECGFQAELIKTCFEDRGKPTIVPMNTPGFDPTKGDITGQYKWNLQNIAKDARAHCKVMIHWQMKRRDDVVKIYMIYHI